MQLMGIVFFVCNLCMARLKRTRSESRQVLGRFESVQDVLVMCLVRMLSCGNRSGMRVDGLMGWMKVLW